MKEKLPKNQTIDFLSVDVEGLDLDVIQSMNIQKYKPRVVLVEILGSTLANIEQDKIYQYLNTSGYDLYAKAVNTVFSKLKIFENKIILKKISLFHKIIKLFKIFSYAGVKMFFFLPIFTLIRSLIY